MIGVYSPTWQVRFDGIRWDSMGFGAIRWNSVGFEAKK